MNSSNPFDAPPEKYVSPHGTQFSMRTLLMVTVAFSGLFSLLSLMGFKPLDTVLAFVVSLVTAAAAMGVVMFVWFLGGGPMHRRVCPTCRRRAASEDPLCPYCRH